MQPERRHYAVLFGASMGLLMLDAPEQMRFAGER